MSRLLGDAETRLRWIEISNTEGFQISKSKSVEFLLGHKISKVKTHSTG